MGPSVIIHNLNFMRLAVTPDEANPPLVINVNAMLTSSIPLERLNRCKAEREVPPASWQREGRAVYGGSRVRWPETPARIGLGTALPCHGIETIESRFIV
jgi:hypothetical protein